MALKDMTGMRFGRLLVIRLGERGPKKQTQWVCACDCNPAREVLIQASGMAAGRTKSCGCLQREAAGAHRITHGNSNTPTYMSWSHAKSRCYRRLNRNFANYGGRGITMCERWRESFAAFLADMGERPSDKHSIDRINNDGHYSCGKCEDCIARGLAANCRWATYKEQARNTRRNLIVEANGEVACVSEWSERTGLSGDMIRARVNKGGIGADVLDPNDRGPCRVIVGPDGTSRRLSEWATISGVSASTILWRIDNGWSEALAASTPKTHRYRPAERKQ